MHLAADARSQAGVERGERLVKEHDLRIGCQGPRQCDPLLLTPRKLVGIAPVQARQAHHVQKLEDPGPTIRPTAQAKGHVASHRKMRKQRSLLGHVANAPMLARHEHVAAIVHHFAAQTDLTHVEMFEPGHDPQQGRLPAARRSEDGGEAPRRDGQIDAVEYMERTERLVDAADGKLLHRPLWPLAAPRHSRRRWSDAGCCRRAGSRSNQRPRT